MASAYKILQEDGSAILQENGSFLLLDGYSSDAITKSLKYSVKITPTALTKSLKYTIEITPTAITKSLTYSIETTPTAITKSLAYSVKDTPTAITKALVYAIKTIPSAITKSLDYEIKKTNAITKSLAYKIKTVPSAKTKSLKYTIEITPTAIQKSLEYIVIMVKSITKSLKYTVKLSPAPAKTKSLRYAIETVPSAITKSLQYAIKNTQWPYRLPITIDHTKVGGDLTNYPAYIDLSLLGDFFWESVKNGGGDIRIFASDGTTELAREVVSCDTATRLGEVHVLVPAVSSSVDTTLYIKFGNPSALDYKVTDPLGRNAVWSDYELALHLKDVTSSTVESSTGGITGTKSAVNRPLEVDAFIGKGQSFNPLGDRIVLNSPILAPSAFTISFLFKRLGIPGGTDKTRHHLIRYFNGVTGSNVNSIYMIANGSYFYGDFTIGGVGKLIDISGTDANNWNRGVFTWDGSNIRGYLNGVLKATVSAVGALSAGSQTLQIGRNSGDYQPNGILDEIRMLDRAVSSDEITTLDNNQSAPSTFWIIGSAENILPTAKALTYKVIAPVQKTKALKYTVTIEVSAVTKSLTYAVELQIGITKGLTYSVKGPVAITKSLKYAVTIEQLGLTKGLQYAIRQEKTTTKSLEYQIRTTTPISKSLAYAVIVAPQITKTLSYNIVNLMAITKGLTYMVETVPPATTKSLTYSILTATALTKSLEYQIATSHPITKSLKYTLTITPSAKTKSLQYVIRVYPYKRQTLNPYARKASPYNQLIHN